MLSDVATKLETVRITICVVEVVDTEHDSEFVHDVDVPINEETVVTVLDVELEVELVKVELSLVGTVGDDKGKGILAGVRGLVGLVEGTLNLAVGVGDKEHSVLGQFVYVKVVGPVTV